MFTSQMSKLFNYLISPFNFWKYLRCFQGAFKWKGQVRFVFVLFSYVSIEVMPMYLVIPYYTFIHWVNIIHSEYHTSQEDEELTVADKRCLQATSNGQGEPGKSGVTLGESDRQHYHWLWCLFSANKTAGGSILFSFMSSFLTFAGCWVKYECSHKPLFTSTALKANYKNH